MSRINNLWAPNSYRGTPVCLGKEEMDAMLTDHSEVMVTVCCICYNHERTLRRALDSFVSQRTDFTYEILIHDDASTDGSRTIIDEYQQRHPRLIRTMMEEENQYSRHASFMGRMFAAARGRYIAYCETDDFWSDPLKLQTQVDALEAHPECAFSVHNTQGVDLQARPLPLRFPPVGLPEGAISPEEYVHHELFEGAWMFQLSSLVARREVIEEYDALRDTGFPSKYYRVGDQPAFLFCLTKGSAWYIDRDMSCYTMDSGGFMTRLGKDSSFGVRVQLGYIAGLEAFDRYSEGRFSKAVGRAVLRREFLCDLALGNYQELFDDRYRELRKEFGALWKLRYRALGLLRRRSPRGISVRGLLRRPDLSEPAN